MKAGEAKALALASVKPYRIPDELKERITNAAEMGYLRLVLKALNQDDVFGLIYLGYEVINDNYTSTISWEHAHAEKSSTGIKRGRKPKNVPEGV